MTRSRLGLCNTMIIVCYVYALFSFEGLCCVANIGSAQGEHYWSDYRVHSLPHLGREMPGLLGYVRSIEKPCSVLMLYWWYYMSYYGLELSVCVLICNKMTLCELSLKFLWISILPLELSLFNYERIRRYYMLLCLPLCLYSCVYLHITSGAMVRTVLL